MILQGKRSRKQAEQFVAKSIESKSSEDNEPADAFSKHLLKQAEKQKRKEQKKKADVKTKNKQQQNSEDPARRWKVSHIPQLWSYGYLGDEKLVKFRNSEAMVIYAMKS